jgi:hypothetical protein
MCSTTSEIGLLLLGSGCWLSMILQISAIRAKPGLQSCSFGTERSIWRFHKNDRNSSSTELELCRKRQRKPEKAWKKRIERLVGYFSRTHTVHGYQSPSWIFQVMLGIHAYRDEVVQFILGQKRLPCTNFPSFSPITVQGNEKFAMSIEM